jgi:hypothetical protein
VSGEQEIDFLANAFHVGCVGSHVGVAGDFDPVQVSVVNLQLSTGQAFKVLVFDLNGGITFAVQVSVFDLDGQIAHVVQSFVFDLIPGQTFRRKVLMLDFGCCVALGLEVFVFDFDRSVAIVA